VGEAEVECSAVVIGDDDVVAVVGVTEVIGSVLTLWGGARDVVYRLVKL